MVRLRRFTNSPSYRAVWNSAGLDWMLLLVVALLIASFVRDHSTEFQAVAPVLILSPAVGFLLGRRFAHSSEKNDPNRTGLNVDRGERNIEDRLDELERLKRRAMVTPEEYEAKRKDILGDL